MSNMSRYQKWIVLFGSIVIIIFVFVIYAAFFSSWGERGWSRIANITISEQENLIHKAGEIDNVDVYTYNLSEVIFINITAKEIRLEELLEKEWMDIDNLLYGDKTYKSLSGESVAVYTEENYMIIYYKNTLVYAPLKEDFNTIIKNISEEENR